MKIEEVYTDLVEKKASATADLDLEGRAIPTGRLVHIETFYVIDETTANKTIKIGYVKAEKTILLDRKPAGTNTYSVFLDRPLILVEGEKPKATVESATSGDVCRLLVKGIILC